MKLLIKLLVILIVFTIALIAQLQIFGAPESLIKAVQSYQAEAYVKSTLLEPNLAVFRNKEGICGEVMSSNIDDEYLRYIATGKDAVLIDDHSASFEDLWQMTCALNDNERESVVQKLSVPV
ncbi:hypothetical protein [Rheinheimera sp. MMS21-TC3]|uniref:hypothetical protein n=1 Tax=Rheinheimera sp. MMS21-TC3 TaxID=3072790 RepID=UPI0028C3997C|nr:hypothetical protein [Rheinheimera sp. MMS21-TC3]WNO60904.1 hypothetical protein RDV63_08045 [Rheinheimera sp. MMS21-TC3]